MPFSRKKFLFWIIVITAVCCAALRVDVMDTDAAQYAEISREMVSSHQWLQVHDLGKDYLDKPPFTFWACSISMSIFGVNNFGYKLPSLLFALLAIWSAFRLATLFYPEAVAALSALVLASSQGFFLMTNDCRTDTILMGAVAFGFWQFAEFDLRGKPRNLVLAALGIGVGMLTKGPIALLVPVFGFGTHFILTRQYRKLFRPSYLVALGIILVMLLPMAIGLYRQFDLHPEKLVNGQRGVSGLKFYFWTQSFGRITGQSNWDNHAGFAFLAKNMLWTFFPWCLVFFVAWGYRVFQALRNRKVRVPSGKEWICLGGFTLTYISLGLSHYQLPHYIFIVFPLAAILTGRFIYELVTEEKLRSLLRWLRGVQYVLIVIGFGTAFLLCGWAFLPRSAGYWTLAALTIGFVLVFFISGKSPYGWVLRCLWAMVLINLILNGYIYPKLLHFEMGSVAGRWVADHRVPPGRFYVLGVPNQSRSLNFYSRRIVPVLENPDSLKEMKGDRFILTDSGHLASLKGEGGSVVLSGSDYGVSLLTGRFLNPGTRAGTTRPYFLVRVRSGVGD
ncbi:MAG TPA: glycosyltransferase family 39 protein [Chitinophagaceae bacterium]|nr:glycosyltransferase family 39 protein [Chitinophagaceae bacterium]